MMVSIKNCIMMLCDWAPTALRTPISRVRSRTATSMTFITLEAAQEQRGQADGAQEVLHAVGHGLEGLRFFDGVPDVGGFFIVGIEIVDPAERRQYLAFAGFVLLHRLGRHQQTGPSRAALAGGLLGKSLCMAEIGDKDLVDIEAVVAGVLVLGLHHPNDFVGNVIQIDGFADGIAPAKQLLLDLSAEERDARVP